MTRGVFYQKKSELGIVTVSIAAILGYFLLGYPTGLIVGGIVGYLIATKEGFL